MAAQLCDICERRKHECKSTFRIVEKEQILDRTASVLRIETFCLQYPIWKKAYAALDGFSKRPDDMEGFSVTNVCNDPTAKCAIAKAFIRREWIW